MKAYTVKKTIFVHDSLPHPVYTDFLFPRNGKKSISKNLSCFNLGRPLLGGGGQLGQQRGQQQVRPHLQGDMEKFAFIYCLHSIFH
jgi:hypothetical protein